MVTNWGRLGVEPFINWQSLIDLKLHTYIQGLASNTGSRIEPVTLHLLALYCCGLYENVFYKNMNTQDAVPRGYP